MKDRKMEARAKAMPDFKMNARSMAAMSGTIARIITRTGTEINKEAEVKINRKTTIKKSQMTDPGAVREGEITRTTQGIQEKYGRSKKKQRRTSTLTSRRKS